METGALEANPAWVLVHRLDEAKRVAATTADASGRKVWDSIFGPEVGRGLGEMHRLVVELRTIVSSRVPFAADNVFRRCDLIDTHLTLSIGRAWPDYVRRLDLDSTIAVLELTASLIDQADPVELKVTDPVGLHELLGRLAAQVAADSSLDPQVQRRVLELLAEALECLRSPRTGTTRGLRQAFEGMAGWLLGDHTLAEKLLRSTAGAAVLAAMVAVRIYAGAPSMPANMELPDPDPQVVVMLESKCVPPMMELESGDVTPEIGPGTTVSGDEPSGAS